jgi:hypothetical protein
MPYDYLEYFEGYGMLEVMSSGAVAMTWSSSAHV